VEYELIVFPDDTHESMLHSRWIYTLDRMEKFIDKHLGGGRKKIDTLQLRDSSREAATQARPLR
jgi:hypothetical protein